MCLQSLRIVLTDGHGPSYESPYRSLWFGDTVDLMVALGYQQSWVSMAM
jgi:hypothetical protein